MYLSVLIPAVRLSHCPYVKDKQPYIRKERAPSWGVHLIIYIKGDDSRR